MENKEYKSFYKIVGGGEGSRCNYPARLDAYGCGCQHNCKYCYAKSLLDFRKLWDNKHPSIANIDKIKRKIENLSSYNPLRLGGMSDCFMPMEKIYKVTYETIKALNEKGIGYLIVTKSNLVADDDYIGIMDKKLAHIQVSITSTDDDISLSYEKASVPSERITAIEKLAKLGFDVQVRLSPYIPQYIDMNIINAIKCDKILVEFLRANSWIKKWFTDVDYSEYTVKDGGYQHLPLERKIELMKKITNFSQITVCEDVPSHYDYWKENVNYNKEDCCNLRIQDKEK